MKKAFVYNIYDDVSESFLGCFVAPTEKVAKKVFLDFIKKNNVDKNDVTLCKLTQFQIPETIEDLPDKSIVDFNGSDFEVLKIEA